MKLATVKVEYTGGLTFTDRVVVDGVTGELHFPPRLIAVMATMREFECIPAINLDYRGQPVPVHSAPDNSFDVVLPQPANAAFRRVLQSLAYPSKDQRQQNGRFLQTLSGASLVGAVGYVHATSHWDVSTIVNAVTLIVFGVASWYVGFLHLKGE